MTIKLIGKLVDMDESHLEQVWKWRNQAHIRDVMFENREFSFEEHLKWYESIKTRDDFISKIYTIDNKPIGVMMISHIHLLNETCNWGFYIGDSTGSKGLGIQMGIFSLDYIFNILKIRKLCSEVMGHNSRSLNFHKKLGFKEEGILKKQIKRDKDYVDVHLMALFNENWEQNKLKLSLTREP